MHDRFDDVHSLAAAGDLIGLAKLLDKTSHDLRHGLPGDRLSHSEICDIAGFVHCCLAIAGAAPRQDLANAQSVLIRSTARLMLLHPRTSDSEFDPYPIGLLGRMVVDVSDEQAGVATLLDCCSTPEERRQALGLDVMSPLSAFALDQECPVAALIAMQAENEFVKDVERRNSSVLELLFQFKEPLKSRLALLVEQFEASPSPGKAKHLQALSEVCWQACGDTSPEMRFVNVVRALDEVTQVHAQDDRPGNWDSYFVADMLQRLRRLGEDFLVEAVQECCRRHTGSCHRGDILSRVLVSQHRPLLELMEPVLPLLMGRSPWQQHGPGGWEDVARTGCDPDFWCEILDTLERVGLDPYAKIDCDPPGWKTRLAHMLGRKPQHTTLMHLVARISWRTRWDHSRFMVLLDKGMDPELRDSDGKVPQDWIDDEHARARWDDVQRSHAARAYADDALRALGLSL